MEIIDDDEDELSIIIEEQFENNYDPSFHVITSYDEISVQYSNLIDKSQDVF